MIRFLTLLFLLLPTFAFAQTALVGGTVHTGTGEVIEGGVVLLGADGKIAAVGANVAVPAQAQVVDVTGRVVTPGFIDVASRLGLVEIWAVSGSRDGDAGPLDGSRDILRAAFRAADGFNPMAVAIPTARAGGVTSVVALPWGGLVAGQAVYAELLGELGHARVVVPSVAMVAVAGAQGGAAAGGSRAGALLTLRQALEDARFYRANRARFDENRARQLVHSRLDAAALGEVLDGKPLFVAVDRAADILAVLALGREFGVNLVLLGAREGWLVAKELAAAKVPVVLDAMDNLPSNFDALGARADNAALLARAGVPVALSTFDAHYSGKLRFHAGNAVREGLDHGAALAAVTRNAAAAAGLDASVGTLAAGKAGNVVVWSGDPFEIATRVEAVYIGGAPAPLDTRQDALLTRYRKLERRDAPAPRAPPAPEPTADGETDVEPND